jgi:starch phosphorylase
MMNDYLVRYYLPGAVAYRQRVGRDAARLLAWREALDKRWDELSFGEYSVETADGADGQMRVFHVEVSAGRVPPDAIRVEVYAEPDEVHVLEKVGDDAHGVFSYSASVPAHRPAGDYTPRIVPWHPSARVPLECDHILWYR